MSINKLLVSLQKASAGKKEHREILKYVHVKDKTLIASDGCMYVKITVSEELDGQVDGSFRFNKKTLSVETLNEGPNDPFTVMEKVTVKEIGVFCNNDLAYSPKYMRLVSEIYEELFKLLDRTADELPALRLGQASATKALVMFRNHAGFYFESAIMPIKY